MRQVELNFEGGLVDQFPEFEDCLKASVYSCGKQFKAIAADLDASSSWLSRALNKEDKDLNFPAYRLDELLSITGDLRPIYWLVEKHCQDADTQRKQAINDLIRLMPKLHELLKASS